MTPVNWALACAGCRFYPSSHPFLNVLDKVQALVLMVCHSFCIYRCFPLPLNQWSLAERTRILLQQSFGILFIIIMRYNRKKLRNLLKSLEKSLKVDDYRQILNYSITLSVPHWTFLLSFTVIDIYFLFKWKGNIVYRVISMYTECNCWMFGASPAFLVSLLALHSCEKNLTNEILDYFSHKTMTVTPTEVSLFLKKLLSKRRLLMQLFSFLPCSWCIYIFAKSVVTIIVFQLQGNQTQTIEIVLYSSVVLCEWTTMILLLVYVMFKIESLLRESFDRLEVLSEKVILRNNTEKWIEVFNDIDRAQKFEYQAWHVFSMNRSFVLSFLSSLLTFTVLFVQLINAIAVNN